MKTFSLSARLFRPAFAAVILLGSALASQAQNSGLGSILGTVTDSSGAVVANATVVITDTDTSVSRTVTTTTSGNYTAAFLQPGHYEIVFGGGSFGKVDRKNLELTVGQTLSIDAALPIGSTSAEVTVTSAPPILDPDKIEVSQTFDPALLANLPIASRNWSAFVLNTPNVVQDGTSGLVSFHGISGLYNQNYVDGSNNNQMLFSEARGRSSGAPYVYSIDSIKEFQAETSNYSVEFGQAAGGQVNAITRSGTNQIHGDAFYYLRYPDLNALDPYSKFQALHNGGTPFLLTQPIHQQNQFGGSVGGPIIKDRLFLFFTYDGFRKVGPRALFELQHDLHHGQRCLYDQQHRHAEPVPGRRHYRLHAGLRDHGGSMLERHYLPAGSSERRARPVSEAESLLPAARCSTSTATTMPSSTTTSSTSIRPTVTAPPTPSPTARLPRTPPPATMSASWSRVSRRSSSRLR